MAEKWQFSAIVDFGAGSHFTIRGLAGLGMKVRFDIALGGGRKGRSNGQI